MFVFGAIQEGIRGPEGREDVNGFIHPEDEVVDDVLAYGVDWNDLGDPALLRHHNQHNENEMVNLDNHINSRRPDHLNLVEVPAFECPFETQEQADTFEQALIMLPEYFSRDMRDRETLWVQALSLMHLLHTSP
ncbi:hypothetical protein MPER_04605 [Moniliophthora perniciosa FA553]|nr:hypothetical protein MPER_04605 [Moniliophthora perniciosa FA553]